MWGAVDVKEYHLANNKYVRGPGWYLNAQSNSRNEMCVVCPRNSYCNGQNRALCPIEYMSDAQSRTLADCKCLPGFHSIQRSQRSTCASCSINYKCSGNGVNTPCRPEEQCKTKRTIVHKHTHAHTHANTYTHTCTHTHTHTHAHAHTHTRIYIHTHPPTHTHTHTRTHAHTQHACKHALTHT